MKRIICQGQKGKACDFCRKEHKTCTNGGMFVVSSLNNPTNITLMLIPQLSAGRVSPKPSGRWFLSRRSPFLPDTAPPRGKSRMSLAPTMRTTTMYRSSAPSLLTPREPRESHLRAWEARLRWMALFPQLGNQAGFIPPLITLPRRLGLAPAARTITRIYSVVSLVNSQPSERHAKRSPIPLGRRGGQVGGLHYPPPS